MATQIDHYLTPDMQQAQKEKTAQGAGIVLEIADAEYVVVGNTSSIGIPASGTTHSGYSSKSLYWVNKSLGNYPLLPKSSQKTMLKITSAVISHSGNSTGSTADGYELYLDDGATTVSSVREGTYYPSSGYWRYTNGNQVVKAAELVGFAEEMNLFTTLTSTERSNGGLSSGTYYWVSTSTFVPGVKNERHAVKTSSGTVVGAKWNGSSWKKVSDGSTVSGVTHFSVNGASLTTVTSSEKSNVK